MAYNIAAYIPSPPAINVYFYLATSVLAAQQSTLTMKLCMFY
jgi:hypothetical protein